MKQYNLDRILLTPEDRNAFLRDVSKLLEDRGFDSNLILARYVNEHRETEEHRAFSGPYSDHQASAQSYLNKIQANEIGSMLRDYIISDGSIIGDMLTGLSDIRKKQQEREDKNAES